MTLPLPSNWSTSILPVSEHCRQKARARLDSLAKPPGALAQLEELAVWLAGAQHLDMPVVQAPRVVVFAADHGVVARGVSPFPQAVTQAMVHTFASGSAAVAVLARQAGATLEVVDVGVRGLGEVHSVEGVNVVRAPVSDGTADLSTSPAMSPEQLSKALQAGADAAERADQAGVDLLAIGEMGIGNTTAASALAARLLGRPAAGLVGPGTGLDAPGVSRKVRVVQEALDRGGDSSPLGALADLGGFELAAMVGCMVRAAQLQMPVLLDGFIVGSAALAAVRLCPGLAGYLMPATASAEPGHVAVLDGIGAGPALLKLGLRLGEASGAALAIPLAKSACAVMAEMATLADVLAAAEG